MRMGDLLHSKVIDRDGALVGQVHDLRLVQDGPKVKGFGPALRVDGLVVGRGSLAIRLGYHRKDVRGPFLLGRIFRGLEGMAIYVPWDVVTTHDGELHLSAKLADLRKVSDIG
jgi:sporulation protein YlmC with PRC-barrel domain